MTAKGPTGRADVELRLPANGAYVSVLRTATASLAARLDFTLDDVEDLRVAIGEASSIVLAAADQDADLRARFWLGQRRVTIAVGARTTAAAGPAEDSFAWMVLTTLAESAAVDTADGELTIVLELAATPLEGPRG